jgi:hypothetical protein
MKKIITLLILFTFFKGNTQCPTPSNLTLTILNATSAQLTWTENGTANSWEIAIIPDFIVGTPLPSDVLYTTASNPFIITGLSPAMGCNVFFVRSTCSTTVVSPWVAVGTLGCSTDVYNYLATLSTNDFSINNDNEVKIFPNPSSSIFKIVSDTNIDKITIFDTLGKEILTQTQNNNEINIEKLSKGLYLIEITSENEKIYKKLIKE